MSYIFVDAVLVDGPDGWHVGAEQLRKGHLLVAGAGADEASLAHRGVAHQHALDQLLVGLLIIHYGQHPLYHQTLKQTNKRTQSPSRSTSILSLSLPNGNIGIARKSKCTDSAS